MKNKKSLSLAIALSLSVAQADEIITTTADQSSLHVTIYNSNTALIKDKRQVTLGEGRQTLAFKDVSAHIQAETAILKADNVNLLEQNLEYDLLTPQTLLNKYVGKTVTVATTNTATGEVTEEQATVLANNQQVMLKIGDKIQGLAPNMHLIYNDVPKNLRDRPTLTMTVDSHTAEPQAVELAYLSHSLNWKADYVANLIDDNTLNLKGWVTLTNSSGTTYHNAQLQLVAGEVNRVRNRIPVLGDIPVKAVSAKAFRKEAAMKEESLFEYHLYTLGFPTTIKDKQQKQVSLLEAANVPYKKRLMVTKQDPYGWNAWGNNVEYQDLTTNAQIVLDNKKANHLGMPIPAGVIRTYLNDSKGNMQFIGEDRVKHTPENESITLQLGESFDVTAKFKQTNFDSKRQVVKNAAKKVTENVIVADYEVVFKNAKDSDAIVEYHDNFYGNWTVLKQSLNSEKLNSTLNRWNVNVPAKGETVLTYSVQIVW